MPHKTDGQSLTGLMAGKTNQWKNRAFSYYHNRISVRTPRYRITKYYTQNGLKIDLYDLKNDPDETINIAKKNGKIIKKLAPDLEKADNGLFEK